MMRKPLSAIVALAFALSFPMHTTARDKKKPPRGMIESMQSLPCGVKQKGLNGLGALWGSIGVTDVSANEKLCPQYLLRTDELEYHIRPQDTKHPVILPVGHEAEFKIKKDQMFLKVPDGDRKTRAYRVIAMEPVKSKSGEENTAYRPPSATVPPGRPLPKPYEPDPPEKPQPHTVNQNVTAQGAAAPE